MREILFKAKRLDNGEWVEGNLLADEFGNYYIGTYIFPKESKIESGGRSNGKTFRRFSGIGFVQVDAGTICQYTGLTDKNGNKIWENDVVEEDFGNHKGVVVWGEFESNVLNNLGFSIDWSKSGVWYRQDLLYWPDKIRVIDNIFDNPELLEEVAE